MIDVYILFTYILKMDISDLQVALFSRGDTRTQDFFSCASNIFNMTKVSMHICLKPVEGKMRVLHGEFSGPVLT